ncbi:MAG: diacylglycerol kinase family lipid kinase [Clostridia bacterium]|nr:diacylglycerol kinase family lipid kinase [Clostridia bacterium]
MLIVNPNSGDGIAQNWVYDMIDILSKRYETISVYFSKSQGDIIRYVSANAKGYDAIVCCGGDGTMHETLNGLLACGEKIPVGYIPTGTTNDFAVSHGIPRNIKAAINLLTDATPHAYDAGMFAGNKAFTYVAAFGAFIDVTYKTPQRDKANFGYLAYIAEGAKRLPDLKPYSLVVETEDRTVTGDFIVGMVTNTRSVGGMDFLMPGQTKEMLSDGKLDITLVSYPTTGPEFQQTVKELTTAGMPQKYVLRFSADMVKFTFKGECPEWTTDGEFGGKLSEVVIKAVPGAINLLEGSAAQ